MFYSHEILTSSEYGVATIWLVATLGSKSTTKKINRRAIQDVDVPKACATIMRPTMPLALRLQGNLLYGVSKVYNQQCSYALTDAQSIRDRIKAMLMRIQGSGSSLDAEASKIRPDQLILPYDPNFLPEVNIAGLNLDVSFLQSPHGSSSRQTSLLSSQDFIPSQTTHQDDVSLQLDISSNISGGEFGRFGISSGISGQTPKEDFNGRDPVFEEDVNALLQPDFEFDGEGNLVELGGRQTPALSSRGNSRAAPFPSESGITDRVRQEIAAGLQAEEWERIQESEQLGSGFNELIGGGLEILEPGEPFRAMVTANEEDLVASANGLEIQRAKKQPRKRPAHVMLIDDDPELRNSHISRWNLEYARNMAIAEKQKRHNKMLTAAKKNGAFWVFGQGIGSVGRGMGKGSFTLIHPLDSFSGETLLKSLVGETLKSPGRKRRKSDNSDDSSGTESRRSRTRDDRSDYVGLLEIDDGRGLGFNDDIEVGREAPASFRDDQSLQLPWNISSSIPGSRHGSSNTTVPHTIMGSAGGYSSVGRPGSIGGRLTSASPLASRSTNLAAGLRSFVPGHGDNIEELGEPDVLGGLENMHGFQFGEDHEFGIEGTGADNNDLVENPALPHSGPAAGLGTPTVRKSRWLAKTLDEDSINFIDYIRAGLEALPRPSPGFNDAPVGEDNDVGIELEAENMPVANEISFSSLFPPETSTKSVAAHALLHVLTLATKKILTVQQDDKDQVAFREIFIRI